MSLDKSSSPEIDRAKDLEIHAQARKEARVLRAEVERFENVLENQQDRDTAAGRSQSSLPGTSVETVTRLQAKRVNFETQAECIRKKEGFLGTLFHRHEKASKSADRLNIPVTSALKNSALRPTTLNYSTPNEYEIPDNTPFQTYDVPVNNQPTAGHTPGRATNPGQANHSGEQSVSAILTDDELEAEADLLSSTKHPEPTSIFERSRVRFGTTVDKLTYSNPSPSREETNTTQATNQTENSRGNLNRQGRDIDELLRSTENLLRSVGYPTETDTNQNSRDSPQPTQHNMDDQPQGTNQQQNRDVPIDQNTVQALIAALRPIMQREIQGLVDRAIENRNNFYDEPEMYENQQQHNRNGPNGHQNPQRRDNEEPMDQDGVHNRNANNGRQDGGRPDDDEMVREYFVGNDLEKSLGDLPSLTDQSIEKLKSFIRMSTIIWTDLRNADERRKFMRRIKLKVIPCSWISEEDLGNANTWQQIRTFLENGLKRELNPQKLRARVNALSQNIGEKLTDYAKRAEDLMRDYEVLHGNQMNDTLRSTIELQIKEQFENGIFDRKTRDAMTMAATEKLQASINLALRIQARKEEGIQANEIICAYCSKRGHRQIECRTRQEHLCQSNAAAATSSEPFCTKCQFRGHTSRDCRMITTQRSDNANRNQNNNNNSNNNRGNNNTSNNSNNNNSNYNNNSGGGRYNNYRNNDGYNGGNNNSNNSNNNNGYNNSGNNFNNNRYNNNNNGYNNNGGNNNNYSRGNNNYGNNNYNNQNQNNNGGQRYNNNNGFNNSNNGNNNNNNNNSGNSNNNNNNNNAGNNQRTVRNVESNQRRNSNSEN